MEKCEPPTGSELGGKVISAQSLNLTAELNREWRESLPVPPNHVAGIKNPYSPARMEWLELLASNTRPTRKGRNTAPIDCQRLGWCDVLVMAPDRSVGPKHEMQEKWRGSPLVQTMAYVILPAGLTALKAWQKVERR